MMYDVSDYSTLLLANGRERICQWCTGGLDRDDQDTLILTSIYMQGYLFFNTSIY